MKQCTINYIFIFSDVKELEKQMSLTEKELKNRLETAPNAMTTKDQQCMKQAENQALQNFVDKASDLVIKLRVDADNAQKAYKECTEYFGEDPKTMDCNTFFNYFVRFISTWKIHEEENAKRRLKQLQTEKLSKTIQEQPKNTPTQLNVSNAMINELKSRQVNKSKPYIKHEPNEFQDGTFENIIMDMKNQPFRTKINTTKGSFRRHRNSTSDGLAISTQETDLV